ncbi:MAG: hypothetical protein ABS99_07820 [Acetobacteraceae bacterium SCN 69-10]|nr:MAG: hypothetical protein ABS99_07820 [Acetobacteraceae bacterium SCN 69-10]OJY76988.1 MAG: hypothetical protein BGP12_06035 [Rhodospirillales bacterium 70-18]
MTAESDATRGEVRVVQPGEAERHWQPVPANGSIAVHLAPDLVRMEHPLGLGTQTVPPGSYVREHSHDRNEEVIHCVSGGGCAMLDGVAHRMVPGTTIFLGRNRRHMFINDGTAELVFVWLIVPNGLETFFRAIGRPVVPGAPDPTPFPRPADVLAIEARTVFAPPPGGAA